MRYQISNFRYQTATACCSQCFSFSLFQSRSFGCLDCLDLLANLQLATLRVVKESSIFESRTATVIQHDKYLDKHLFSASLTLSHFFANQQSSVLLHCNFSFNFNFNSNFNTKLQKRWYYLKFESSHGNILFTIHSTSYPRWRSMWYKQRQQQQQLQYLFLGVWHSLLLWFW